MFSSGKQPLRWDKSNKERLVRKKGYESTTGETEKDNEPGMGILLARSYDDFRSAVLSATSVQVQQRKMMQRRAERLGVSLPSLSFAERNEAANIVEPPLRKPIASIQQQEARDRLRAVGFDFEHKGTLIENILKKYT